MDGIGAAGIFIAMIQIRKSRLIIELSPRDLYADLTDTSYKFTYFNELLSLRAPRASLKEYWILLKLR